MGHRISYLNKSRGKDSFLLFCFVIGGLAEGVTVYRVAKLRYNPFTTSGCLHHSNLCSKFYSTAPLPNNRRVSFENGSFQPCVTSVLSSTICVYSFHLPSSSRSTSLYSRVISCWNCCSSSLSMCALANASKSIWGTFWSLLYNSSISDRGSGGT